MAATSYLLAMRNGLLMFAPLAGSEITAGLLPTVAGALAGFLYGQFAGLMAVAVAPQAGSACVPPRRLQTPPRRVASTVRCVFALRSAPS